jgi:hypothetical protein
MAAAVSVTTKPSRTAPDRLPGKAYENARRVSTGTTNASSQSRRIGKIADDKVTGEICALQVGWRHDGI